MKSMQQQIWDKMRERPDCIALSKAYWALEEQCQNEKKKLKKKQKPLRRVQKCLMAEMESIRAITVHEIDAAEAAS